MAMYRHFQYEWIGNVLVVRLVDRKIADAMSVNELQDELLSLLDREATKKLLVNFRNVQQCSTAVINSLLAAKKRLLQLKGQIKLCEMSPLIREAYQLLNLDGTVFHIHDTEAESLAAFNYL